MRRIAAASLVVVLAVALTACGEESTFKGEPSPSPSPTARPSSTGRLEILEPTNGQVIKGTRLVVRVKVTGAEILTGAATTDVRPDTGHIHVSLDGETLTLLAGAEYVVPPEKVTPGDHLILAEFAAADHGPFNPRVTAAVQVTVE